MLFNFDFLTNTNVGFTEIVRYINTEEKAIELFKKFKVINYNRCVTCDCGNKFLIKHRSLTSKAKFQWTCTAYCHPLTKKINPLRGSWFERSSISFLKHLELLLHWIFKLKVDFTMLNARVACQTLTTWNERLNKVCQKSLKKVEKIGGNGVRVKVDETFMFHRKYNVGRQPKNVWLFGGVERTDDRKCFIVQVKNRKRSTLFKILKKHVKKGTILYTDDFKSYYGVVEKLGFAAHCIVVHKENFVNPDFPDVHTNGIESKWDKIKKFCIRSGDKKAVDLYISRFLYRHKLLRLYGERAFGMKLIHVLKDIKKAYRTY